MNQKYEESLKGLREHQEIREENGIEVIIRQCPEREPGRLDPRTAYLQHLDQETFTQEKDTLEEHVLKNETNLFHTLTPGVLMYEDIDVGVFRQLMGWYNDDISRGIERRDVEVAGHGCEIPIRIYEDPTVKGEKPAVIFFHGGGFIGGSPDVVENPCKAIAQKANAVVFSVDYRLCPEYPFPMGLDDCYDVVCWVYEQAESLHVDRKHIGVAGDSAGGNLAAVCSLKDRDEKRGMIHYQALLYPTLTRSGPGEEFYYWNKDIYDNRYEDPEIEGMFTFLGTQTNVLNTLYLQGKTDKNHPYAAPLAQKNNQGLPKTIIMTAEYDYLRGECEAYVKKLAADGVDVTYIRYGGVGHAFMDKLGYLPQAEDSLDQIAEDMMNLT